MFEKQLSTKIQNTGLRAESSAKRKHNIQWIIDLPRAGLAFRNSVKQVLITTTQGREEVFIQYPGKETVRNKDIRPWYFFPRVRNSGTYGKDLDFRAIWDILCEGLHRLIDENMDWAAVLATVFYRMAFLNDHYLAEPHKMTIRKLKFSEAGLEEIIQEKAVEIPALYRYLPPKQVLDAVSGIVPLWGGMSFEAFLHYNDLLAWNEDCKYYYRTQQSKSDAWIRNTGRVNTLLSHLSIIGNVSGKISLSELCMKFARGKGVAPATREEIIRVCNDYVSRA